MSKVTEKSHPAIPLGTRIEPWGSVSGVTNMGGERYYFFVEKGVALIPGVDVERHYAQQHQTSC